jgi:predicted dehydrogenase
MESLRDNPRVQAVYIVTPNGLHALHTLKALSAGKHVLCEKPLATSVGDAEKMVAKSAAAGRKLMTAYRIQYEPRNRLVQQWVRSKALGEVKLLELHNSQNQSRENASQWRHKKVLAGGGALPDIGLYCLNTARFLLGEEPVEVGATMQSTPSDPRFREVEETVSFWLRFPSGVLATCLSSYGTADVKRYRVVGTEGYVDMDPGFSYRGLKLRRARVAEDAKAMGVEDLAVPEKNQFALELDHFAACIVQDKKPYTPGEEGLQDQRILAAIYEAARTFQVVRLPTVAGRDAFRGPAPKDDA